MGDALISHGDGPACIAWLRKAQRQHPDDVIINFDLGWHLGELPTVPWDEVLRFYQAALAGRPQSERMHVMVANTLLSMGRSEEALAAFSRVIELKADKPNGWHGRGVAYANLSQWDKALADFSKAVELNPRFVSARVNRGNIYGRLSRFTEAQADYRNVLEVAPASAVAHNNLAWLLATCPDSKFRDPGQAVKLAKKAVALTPNQGGYWNTLGVAQFRSGEWKAATDALHKSVELGKGGDANDWYFLAMAHWRLGEKDEARKWFDRADAWMDKKQNAMTMNRHEWDESTRFRAEAAELIGSKKK